MERTGHVLLVGAGAEEFAVECGFEQLPPDAGDRADARKMARHRRAAVRLSRSNGTVGCVARDAEGRVAAATSTGGMLLKRRGQVGDSPLIGAGTYADDLAGAASCTGAGRLSSRRWPPRSRSRPCGRAPRARSGGGAGAGGRAAPGGDGGIICVDRHGRVGFAFDSARMTRLDRRRRWAGRHKAWRRRSGSVYHRCTSSKPRCQPLDWKPGWKRATR